MSSRPEALLSLPSYLAGQLAKIGRASVKTALAPHDLALPQYAILTALDEFGPCSQQELAQRLELDKSNVVKLLDGLEEHALVERSPSPLDRRRHGVSITKAGRKTAQAIAVETDGRENDVLEALSEPERVQLLALMRRVIDDHDAKRSG